MAALGCTVYVLLHGSSLPEERRVPSHSFFFLKTYNDCSKNKRLEGIV
jgi:hypothetical protein